MGRFEACFAPTASTPWRCCAAACFVAFLVWSVGREERTFRITPPDPLVPEETIFNLNFLGDVTLG